MKTDAPENTRLHAWVEGTVQGVGFRFFVQQRAAALGLSGWVRNLWDGRVEVVAEGPREALEALVGDLRRGPRSARVGGLSFEWQTPRGEFRGFHVRPTG